MVKALRRLEAINSFYKQEKYDRYVRNIANRIGVNWFMHTNQRNGKQYRIVQAYRTQWPIVIADIDAI